MDRIIIEPAFQAQLAGVSAPVQLFTSGGEALGMFLPASLATYRDADQCPYSDEALAAMQRESGGRALPAIWRDLDRT
jgi:hypothetical protein